MLVPSPEGPPGVDKAGGLRVVPVGGRGPAGPPELVVEVPWEGPGGLGASEVELLVGWVVLPASGGVGGPEGPGDQGHSLGLPLSPTCLRQEALPEGHPGPGGSPVGVGSSSVTSISRTVAAVPDVTVLLASTWGRTGLVTLRSLLKPRPQGILPAPHLCVEDPGLHQLGGRQHLLPVHSEVGVVGDSICDS